jgi:hypothetical protein
LIMTNTKQKELCVCGECGYTEGDLFTGYCALCGADHWVQIADFDNPELCDYLVEACENLGISMEALRAATTDEAIVIPRAVIHKISTGPEKLSNLREMLHALLEPITGLEVQKGSSE